MLLLSLRVLLKYNFYYWPVKVSNCFDWLVQVRKLLTCSSRSPDWYTCIYMYMYVYVYFTLYSTVHNSETCTWDCSHLVFQVWKTDRGVTIQQCIGLHSISHSLSQCTCIGIQHAYRQPFQFKMFLFFQKTNLSCHACGK